MLFVTCHRADDGIHLAADTVLGTFGVAFGLSSFVFSLSLGVLLFPGRLPGLPTSHITDGLDDVAFGGMELTGGLAETEPDVSFMKVGIEGEEIWAYLGSL